MYPSFPLPRQSESLSLMANSRVWRGYGPEGIRTLDLSVSLGRPSGARDKSRSLYLAKLQARGGAYWARSIKRYVDGQPPPHSRKPAIRPTSIWKTSKWEQPVEDTVT